ncbi:hypothetical protein J1605_018116 [Eschrichtius robustus]|uniref:Uncharacterized protein n=1 Tax=Eschrichtius robustus TaxID=9764 RepID=A0AB34I0P2_ESCRO|nr:hypothetical protein J1605_018116 [Eschrichtius robustus]
MCLAYGPEARIAVNINSLELTPSSPPASFAAFPGSVKRLEHPHPVHQFLALSRIVSVWRLQDQCTWEPHPLGSQARH